MHYSLAYDVLNDGFPWFGVWFASVPLLLAVVYFLEFFERMRGGRPSLKPNSGRMALAVTPAGVLVVSFVLLGCFGVFPARQNLRPSTKTLMMGLLLPIR
jgi:hypothetical protein